MSRIFHAITDSSIREEKQYASHNEYLQEKLLSHGGTQGQISHYGDRCSYSQTHASHSQEVISQRSNSSQLTTQPWPQTRKTMKATAPPYNSSQTSTRCQVTIARPV